MSYDEAGIPSTLAEGSFKGWLDYTDAYNYYLYYIKPKINFQQLKRRISAYDRRIQKRKREQTTNN